MTLRSSLTCFTVVVALGIAHAGCAGAPSQRPVKGGPVDQGPQTLTAARKYLEGNWALESFEVYPPGKPAITLKGSGTLIYDDFGAIMLTPNAFASVAGSAAVADLTSVAVSLAGAVR